MKLSKPEALEIATISDEPNFRDRLRDLSRSNDESVLIEIAKNPLTPVDVLQDFLSSNNPDVILHTLANQNLAEWMIDKAVKRYTEYSFTEEKDSMQLRFSFDALLQISKSCRFPRVLEELFVSTMGLTEKRIALNTAPYQMLEILNNIAANHHTEEWILKELVRYDLSHVKESAAANFKTPMDALEVLFQEGHYTGLLLNDKFPFERKMKVEYLKQVSNFELLELFFLRYDKLIDERVKSFVYQDLTRVVARAMMTSPKVRRLLSDDEKTLLALEFGIIVH